MPVSTFNPQLPATVQAMPSNTMPSTPALLSAKVVPDGFTASSDNDSTLVGATHTDKSLGDPSFDNMQPSTTNPVISTKAVLNKPTVNASKEHNKIGGESSNDSKVKQNNDKGNDRPNKRLSSKQDHCRGTVAKSSKKRKAESSSGKKAADLDLHPPAKKKQKINKPTAKRQRKVGNSKPKTAKERFLAASAEDTRPLPWGEPEVWAEV